MTDYESEAYRHYRRTEDAAASAREAMRPSMSATFSATRAERKHQRKEGERETEKDVMCHSECRHYPGWRGTSGSVRGPSQMGGSAPRSSTERWCAHCGDVLEPVSRSQTTQPDQVPEYSASPRIRVSPLGAIVVTFLVAAFGTAVLAVSKRRRGERSRRRSCRLIRSQRSRRQPVPAYESLPEGANRFVADSTKTTGRLRRQKTARSRPQPMKTTSQHP